MFPVSIKYFTSVTKKNKKKDIEKGLDSLDYKCYMTTLVHSTRKVNLLALCNLEVYKQHNKILFINGNCKLQTQPGF